jgi:penicillin-binding protein 2
MVRAIEISCNPYFWKTFNSIFTIKADVHDNFNIWRNHVLSFGFGDYFESDLFSENRGFIPQTKYFDKYFGETGWRALTIRSLSIGQGEILVTPLQLANFATTIANRGYYYKPHLVKFVETHGDSKIDSEKIFTTIDQKHFETIVEGMHRVFEGDEGTARWYKLDSISICGKTGTAENPHGEDHSVFIAFAPKDNPQIALSVVVENAGFGATWAVPMATLMIEKYLTGEINRAWVEERMINGNLLEAQ